MKIEQKLQKAISHHKAGELLEAEQLYRAILLEKPQHPDANHNLGVAIVGLGKTEESLRYFKSALESNSNIGQFWVSYLNALIDLGQYDNAKSVLNQAAELGVKGDAFDQLYVRLKDQNKGKIGAPQEEEVQELINLYNKGRLQEVIKKIETMIVSFPSAYALFNLLGAAKIGLGRPDSAIVSYQRAIKIKPDLAEAHYNIGIAYKEAGDLDSAIESYQKAIKLNPDYAEAHLNIGIAQKGKGNLDAAIESYQKAIKIKPDYAEAHNNIGIAQKGKGNLDSAIESFQQALKIKPELSEASSNLNDAKTKNVPLWHVPMMNDELRNNAFEKALELAIKGDELVIEIGTGSGLLSMMAVDNGADLVITCEASRTIAKTAHEIIGRNGFSKKINVIHKRSTDLMVEKDIPRKADVIIAEILSAQFVGEGVTSSIYDARSRLLKKGGIIIPEAGDVKICLLEATDDMLNKYFVETVNKYDLSPFNRITGRKGPIDLDGRATFLSEPEIAFNFNLYDSQEIPVENKVIQMTANRSGLCVGIVQWLKICLFEHIEYENDPSLVRSHWPTPTYFFDEPIYLTAGQSVDINANLFENGIWFYQKV